MGLILAEKYRLIEKPDADSKSTWKGLHMIIHCMAFVFGGFCSFFFHMLMYMFEGKCILFPQLRSFYFTEEYELTLIERERNPLDFVTTVWQDSRFCLFPVYLPLLSSISGLVWTTMFLLSGSGVVAGFQRSWWVLPFSFIFSLVMGCSCLYTSINTHWGLSDLCNKISKISHGSYCDHPLTIITALYEKRITNLHRIISITILTSWCSTICWIVAVILIIARVCMVVDFQLVKVTVELKGDITKILDKYETEIKSFPPDLGPKKPEKEDQSKIDTDEIDIQDIKPLRRTRSAPLRLLFNRESVVQNIPNKDDIDMRSVRFAKDSSHELLEFRVSDNESSTPKGGSNVDNIYHFKSHVTEIFESNIESLISSSSETFDLEKPSTSKHSAIIDSKVSENVYLFGRESGIVRSRTQTELIETSRPTSLEETLIQDLHISSDQKEPTLETNDYEKGKKVNISSKETIKTPEKTQDDVNETFETLGIKALEDLKEELPISFDKTDQNTTSKNLETNKVPPLVIKDTETIENVKSLSKVHFSNNDHEPDMKTPSENTYSETSKTVKLTAKTNLSSEDNMSKNENVSSKDAGNADDNANSSPEVTDPIRYSEKDKITLPSIAEADNVRLSDYADISSNSSKHSGSTKKKRRKKAIQSKTKKPGSSSSSESQGPNKPSTSRRKK